MGMATSHPPSSSLPHASARHTGVPISIDASQGPQSRCRVYTIKSRTNQIASHVQKEHIYLADSYRFRQSTSFTSCSLQSVSFCKHTPNDDAMGCPCSQDVKTLKRDVKLNFPDLSDDDMEALLPAKAEVQLLKLKNKATAYSCGGADPLFFDPEGRGDLLVPTVHALWRCPHMLDKLLTYSEVSPKVRRSGTHACS